VAPRSCATLENVDERRDRDLFDASAVPRDRREDARSRAEPIWRTPPFPARTRPHPARTRPHPARTRPHPPAPVRPRPHLSAPVRHPPAPVRTCPHVLFDCRRPEPSRRAELTDEPLPAPVHHRLLQAGELHVGHRNQQQRQEQAQRLSAYHHQGDGRTPGAADARGLLLPPPHPDDGQPADGGSAIARRSQWDDGAGGVSISR
jgi:hypothetical protein